MPSIKLIANNSTVGRWKLKQSKIIILVVSAIIFIIIYMQLTIFVIQPIGAVPEGRTLIITRLNKTEFIDSADAMCSRDEGGVSLFCRMIVLGAVMDKSTVIARLPYSSFLYDISTGGKSYNK